jgi:ectoine hydroxylase-related dioxygenase (phytanoyl-CoA dioxygenase family)
MKRLFPGTQSAAKRQTEPTPEWYLELEEKGWTVVPDVLSPERSDYYRDRMFDMLESFEGSGFSRDAPNSWNKSRPPGPHGLIQNCGVGQTKLVWEARLEPQVLKVFSRLWHCELKDLLVSFDAVNFSPPTQGQNAKPWKHIDQGRRTIGQRVCVQGCLQVSQCNGATSFITGSHKYHSEFLSQEGVGEDNKNWVKLRAPQDYDFFAGKGLSIESPLVTKGSLILWDSRTVHDAKLPSEGYRMCIYVCYVPRAKASKAQLRRKQQVFSSRRMSTHWPFGDRMFPLESRFTTTEQRRIFTRREPIKDEEMTELGWKLAGF